MRTINTNRGWTTRVAGAGLAAVLMLSGCGGDEGGSTETSSTTSAPASSPEETDASAESSSESAESPSESAESASESEESPEPSNEETTTAPKPAPSPTTEPGPNPSTPAESTAPAASSSATAGCTDGDLKKAVDANIDKVPTHSDDPRDAWHLEESSSQFTCEGLSWAVLITDGMGAVPSQIMLFHDGEYLGTTLKDPQTFIPEVKRTGKDAIAVTYTYVKGDESSGEASGRATATFTWDPRAKKVVQAGELPPGDEQADCTGLTLEQAVEKNIGKVPQAEELEGYEWYLEPDSSEYDECAALSWAVLGIRGTASSPYQIMLFHHGHYIGTTLKKAPGFMPEVKRLDDGSIQVTYTYAKEDEATAEASGRAVATFTWDAEAGKVVQSGELPPLP
ncbi:LppP/LprE family lipoprotein [Kytococcus sedentarius]|uniref:LppP/LprE family lipoprotein n=1 Tax=Kytococcus sedentarius TaxID=1276 RepID=UPI0035BC901B